MSATVMTPQWYTDYLATPRWRAIRIALLARADNRCQSEGCWQRVGLEVHHLTYERLGAELPGDLKVLCFACHQRAHGLPVAPRVRPTSTRVERQDGVDRLLDLLRRRQAS